MPIAFRSYLWHSLGLTLSIPDHLRAGKGWQTRLALGLEAHSSAKHSPGNIGVRDWAMPLVRTGKPGHSIAQNRKSGYNLDTAVLTVRKLKVPELVLGAKLALAPVPGGGTSPEDGAGSHFAPETRPSAARTG